MPAEAARKVYLDYTQAELDAALNGDLHQLAAAIERAHGQPAR